jgi:hypothetical protein
MFLLVYMLLLTGTVADFVDTILTQVTAEESIKDMNANELCLRAERMANEVVETIVINDETLPGIPKATNTYPPSSL